MFVKEVEEGIGRLVITSQRIIWIKNGLVRAKSFFFCNLLFLGSVEVGKGWEFRDIALHAISRACENFKFPAIYCQLIPTEQSQNDEYETQEIRFVPSTDSMLQGIYDTMSKGAAMNPDPMSDDDGQLMNMEIDVNEDLLANHNNNNNIEEEQQDEDEDQKFMDIDEK